MKDALAVLDETGTDSAVVAAISTGAQRAMLLAAEHPKRVCGLVLEGPYFIGTRRFEALIKLAYATFDRFPVGIGALLKFNGKFIKSKPDAFIDWFAQKLFNVPHSTKQIEDAIE